MIRVSVLTIYKTLFFILLMLKITSTIPVADKKISKSDDQTTNEDVIQDFTWSSLHRTLGSPDTIYLNKNQQDCIKISATLSNVTKNDDKTLSCQCSISAPVFNPENDKCIDRLDNDCTNGITFDSHNIGDSIYLPILTLPKKGSEIIDGRKIRWKDSGIFIKGNESTCHVLTKEILDSTVTWRIINGDIFKFINDNGITRMIWDGLPKQARMMEGGIVKIKLHCSNSTKLDYCMTFRIQGYQFSGISDIDLSSIYSLRLTIVVIIILAISLVLVSFLGVILWIVCWRIKKTEIISNFQLQFLQHIKQEKERTAVDAAKYRAALAAAQHGEINGRGHCFNSFDDKNCTDLSMMYRKDNSSVIINGQNTLIQQKRKLYFSTEFFEPHMMANPPELAEQFLVDLRKMIDSAKKRIKAQKHVPSLLSIPEESPNAVEELQDIITDIKEEIPSTSNSNSPKSTKSSDSGRESMKDSGSSSDSSSVSPVLKKKEIIIEDNINIIPKDITPLPSTEQVTKLKKIVKPSLANSKNVANLIGAFEQKKETINESFVAKDKPMKVIDKEPSSPIKPLSKIPKPSDKSIAISPKLSQRKLIPVETLSLDNDIKKTTDTPVPLRKKSFNNGNNDKNSPTSSKIPAPFTNFPIKERLNSYSIISTGSEAMRKKSLPRKSKKPSIVLREGLKEPYRRGAANQIPTVTKTNSNGVIETNM
uniref:MAM domain-containing protein n=1 Tax=Parastrongyloides trichosuri TaxID=131310 RepID=A0A0N4ZBE7_PARTI